MYFGIMCHISVMPHNEDFPNPAKLEKGSLHGNISCIYERVSWQERTALLRNATMSTESFGFRSNASKHFIQNAEQ
jgi:hypothetical protein